MTGLAILLSVVTGALALVHAAWALGFWFPFRDEAVLVRAAVGIRGAERMPGPIPCVLVSMGMSLAIGALWADLAVSFWVIFAAGMTFVARGLLTYMPTWRRMAAIEPFATLDRRLYGPMCLGLGIGYLAMLTG